ncbi:hypothetical protein [Burkholderia ubonensis]|uniref:hypothetical protein n=1 Tax=Burkholderia ubonensis TaxID=101571 RepID=UPI0012F8958A|nr:hypothetical protein [Burkholderia ubonensis]
MSLQLHEVRICGLVVEEYCLGVEEQRVDKRSTVRMDEFAFEYHGYIERDQPK